MEIKEAKQIGSKQAIKATIFLFLILELAWFFIETHGDFANGILFFIDKQLNIRFLGLIVQLFGSAYFFGRNVGKEIIISKRKPFLVGIKYAFLAGFIFLAYIIILALYDHSAEVSMQFIMLFTFEIIIPMVIIWLWAAWRINKRADKTENIDCNEEAKNI